MCMLSWNSRSIKPLKVPSDSISEGLIFKNFLGERTLRPPGMLLKPNRAYAPHTIIMFTTMYLCPPPLVNPGSAPGML